MGDGETPNGPFGTPKGAILRRSGSPETRNPQPISGYRHADTPPQTEMRVYIRIPTSMAIHTPGMGTPLRGAPWGIWGNGMCPLGTSHLWIALIPGIRWSKYPIWDPKCVILAHSGPPEFPHIPRSAEPVPDWGAEVLGTNSGFQEYPKWGLGNPYFRPMREDNGPNGHYRA